MADVDRAVSAEVEALEGLDIHELRIRWRKLFRSSAPPHLPRYLLLRIIAYRIQANAYGDLHRETRRFLDGIGRELRKRRANGEGRSKKASPLVPPVPARRSLKPGTILVREHDGLLHRVIVTDDGYSWNGTTYRSLSETARAITGTNWNGPLFFGLRERPGAGAPSSQEHRHEGQPEADPLRHLHPGLDRPGAGAGVQFPRQSARGRRGLRQEPGP